ncbi:hypothetical protein GC176_20420 [bacterium]|nr:hypothetical protein [bacterium]
MVGIPDSVIDVRDRYCQERGEHIPSNGEFWWGLDAFLWQTASDSILKVHRYKDRFAKELAAYQRLADRHIVRLQGFRFPQLLDYDPELHILELSFVSPPYILDFVEVYLGDRPASFDLDRIETESRQQFGRDWLEVRRLLEALMHFGIYYDDVHNQNIRLR